MSKTSSITSTTSYTSCEAVKSQIFDNDDKETDRYRSEPEKYTLLCVTNKKNYVPTSLVHVRYPSTKLNSETTYKFDLNVQEQGVGNFLDGLYIEYSRPSISVCKKKKVNKGISKDVPVFKQKLCFDEKENCYHDRKGRKHCVKDDSSSDDNKSDDQAKSCSSSSSCTSYCKYKDDYKKYENSSCSSSSSSSSSSSCCSSDCSSDCRGECKNTKNLKCHIPPKCVYPEKEDICMKDFALYTNGFALAAIKSIKLKHQSSTDLQSLNGISIHMINELYVDYGLKNYRMMGFYNSINQGIRDSVDKTTLYAEIPFFFATNEGDSLFLDHARERSLTVELERYPLKDLLIRSGCDIKILNNCNNKEIEEDDIIINLITSQQITRSSYDMEIRKLGLKRQLLRSFESEVKKVKDQKNPTIKLNPGKGVLKGIHFTVQSKENRCHNEHLNLFTRLGTEPVCEIKLKLGGKVIKEGRGSFFSDLTNSMSKLQNSKWPIYTIPLSTHLDKSWYTGGSSPNCKDLELELKLDDEFKSCGEYKINLTYVKNVTIAYDKQRISQNQKIDIIRVDC